jgi:outer membrane protein assembly factor BamB
MVFSGFSDGSFVAFNVNDGSMIWEKKLNSQGKFTDVDARAVLSNGIIYVPAYDGALYALKRDNGEILWKFDAGGAKQVLIDDDRLYLPSSDSFVYAIQKSSGRELWKFPLDRGVPSILIQEGPYLFFASTFQYLYAIQKSDGKPVSRFNVGWGSGFSGAPAYDPETRMIYWISGAGNLYTFRIK